MCGYLQILYTAITAIKYSNSMSIVVPIATTDVVCLRLLSVYMLILFE